ncbi:MAG: hypothetical protein M1501_02465 [Candidatus Omnitrophica bacterium]|nr:hypothetical protein [Candidatus Omnitrophota bacterium]
MAKVLNWISVEKKIGNSGLTLFTPIDLKHILDVSKISVQFFLTRYTKKGAIIKLRRGLYTLSGSIPSEFEIANALIHPSYISLTFALAYYHIIPEMTYVVTSITTRATYNFEILNREFRYHKIKKPAFTGYIPEKIGGKTILIAEKEKALVDYLYFVSRKVYTGNSRLNISSLSKKKIYQYAQLFNSTNLEDMIKELYA